MSLYCHLVRLMSVSFWAMTPTLKLAPHWRELSLKISLTKVAGESLFCCETPCFDTLSLVIKTALCHTCRIVFSGLYYSYLWLFFIPFCLITFFIRYIHALFIVSFVLLIKLFLLHYLVLFSKIWWLNLLMKHVLFCVIVSAMFILHLVCFILSWNGSHLKSIPINL